VSEVTVKQLAVTIDVSVEHLLTQLREAGIAVTDADAVVSEQEKRQLLTYLRRSHGKAEAETAAVPERVTLKRKSVSELRQTGAVGARPASGGRATLGARPSPVQRATKTVSVEVRRKRTYVRCDEGGGESPAPRGVTGAKPPVTAQPLAAAAGRAPNAVAREGAGEARRQTRIGDEQRRRAALEARRAEEEARRLAEREEAERQQKREEARRRAEDEERRRLLLEEEARRREEEARAALLQSQAPPPIVESPPAAAIADTTLPPAETPAVRAKPARKPAERPEKEREKDKVKTKETTEKDKPGKRVVRKEPLRGKHADSIDYEEEDGGDLPFGRLAVRRRKKPPVKPQLQDKHGFQRPIAPVVREVIVPETISVVELAARMSVKASEVIKELFKQGMAVTINQTLDRDTATLVIEELGHKAVIADERNAEDTLRDLVAAETEQAERLPRPPVVTIMGHVDHGKTSLLDYIRRTRVAVSEAGGITQHIGAYHVKTSQGIVTFLDTPGHAAFSAMRARGAQVTDIVILVVAADDGVMPQTIEAIQHARAARVPVIAAVNKIDKADANPDRVAQELVQHGLVPEEWGGDTMMVKVSAKTGAGIDALLDAVLLQAEMLELTAPVTGSARGTIVESSLEKGRGPVATVLVQSGTLRVGDMVVCGSEYGRVRALFDENGQAVPAAGPSIPVRLLGLSGAPNAGDDLIAVADERRAREVAELRQQRERQSKIDAQGGVRLDDLFGQFKAGEQKAINLILKADVQGSVEALRDSLLKLSTDEVKVNVVAAGVGGLTESDAHLAVTSNAILLGFNVRADAAARRIIEEKGLDLRYYSIIYELLDDVKKALAGLLGPVVSEEIIGLAEVRDVFRSSRFGAIAGSMVLEGVIRRNHPIRVLRNHVVIYEGALESLRRFKDDVQEVKAGMECGIGVKNYNDVRVGDQIEVFERTERVRVL